MYQFLKAIFKLEYDSILASLKPMSTEWIRHNDNNYTGD